MRNLEPDYREFARSQGIVALCLQQARKRFPGKQISFCGLEDRWEDCLTGYLSDDGKQLAFLFWFNIEDYSRGVGLRFDLPDDFKKKEQIVSIPTDGYLKLINAILQSPQGGKIMPEPEQTNNETSMIGINRNSSQEPTTVYKFEGTNFYDNHIIRKMPLPTWDVKDYPK